MLPRPRIVLDCCSSCCSLTAFFVGLTDCVCAAAGRDTRARASNNGAATARMAFQHTTNLFAPPAKAGAHRSAERAHARRLVTAIIPSSERRSNGSRPSPGRQEAADARCLHSSSVRLGAHRFAIGRLPAPGSGAVAALSDALLVDFLDDLAVAGEQRLGCTHLGA